MIEHNFPYIKYQKDQTYHQWGTAHGEEFRDGIKELVEIRKSLMLAKNPSLTNSLDELAKIQFDKSKEFAPLVADEILGISEGANITLTEVVILNNYTDFRDCQLPEEGCSTIHVDRKGEMYSGQTWDMHGSAKKYVSVLHIPEKDGAPETLCFSLVGCVGMMGVNTQKCLIGVNNINTMNAQAGVIWPLLVRKVLHESALEGMRDTLTRAPVTSGHNYILSSLEGGEHWEVTPGPKQRVSQLEKGTHGEIFHTNHCLGKDLIGIEDQSSLSSTTHARFELLEKKAPLVQSYKDFKELLTDHDGYPKSICSHFESGAQDPSFTCGGGVANINKGDVYFWRGCPHNDDNFVDHTFKIENNSFVKFP